MNENTMTVMDDDMTKMSTQDTTANPAATEYISTTASQDDATTAVDDSLGTASLLSTTEESTTDGESSTTLSRVEEENVTHWKTTVGEPVCDSEYCQAIASLYQPNIR